MSDKPEIVVIGRFEIEATRLEAVRSAMLAMQEASRAEDGCQDYTFSVELGDPAVVRLSERWDDMDALRRHFTMPHMGVFQEALGANPPSGREVHFFEATEVAPPTV